MLVYWEAFNPLNAELNPICQQLALIGAHHILHVSRIRVNLKLRNKNATRVTFLVKFKRKQLRISYRESPQSKCPALVLCWTTRWEIMEMSTCSSNSWLVWTQQLSALTKLTLRLACISSHQARKLLLIPYPRLSVHVYGISCSFIGHFPWSSHELISPEQASQPWKEILIPGRSCSGSNTFHIFSFILESNSIQEYRLCHSFVTT